MPGFFFMVFRLNSRYFPNNFPCQSCGVHAVLNGLVENKQLIDNFSFKIVHAYSCMLSSTGKDFNEKYQW